MSNQQKSNEVRKAEMYNHITAFWLFVNKTAIKLAIFANGKATKNVEKARNCITLDQLNKTTDSKKEKIAQILEEA